MKKLLAAIIGAALLGSALTAQAAEKAIIVLDVSGSMWGQIDGEAKMTIARRTLRDVLGTTPPSLELGLMAYGHRDKGSCDDIELIIPPALGTGGEIAAAADGLTPRGKTPISAAVTKAAEELRYTEDKATVILVTDGLETCQADPCATATALEEAGIDLTVHVVGFGLSDEEGAQVACLAENTGGRYLSASNAGNLGAALTETVAQAVDPSPPNPPPPTPPPAKKARPDKNLKIIARPSPEADPFTGSDGIRYDIYPAPADGYDKDSIDTGYGQSEYEVPVGRYVVRASKDLVSGEAAVDVTAESQAVAEIVLNAAYIHATAMATETETVGDAGVRWDVTDSGGETDISYGPTRTILVAAGEATVMARLGEASATVPVMITAGENEEVVVVLGSGTLVLRGKRAADATDYDSGIRWDVSGDSIDTQTSYGGEVKFDLPAGDYTVKATLGEAVAEIAVALPAGKTIEKEVVVATGKVIAHALFAEGGPAVTEGARFDILESEPGIDGERKTITTAYNDGASFDLPPGKYLLRASADICVKEAAFDLKAGPPLEVSVVLDAGLLAVTAPGGDRLDLLGTKKDIYGKQAILATRYGEDWQVTVPAGEYLLKVTKGDGTEETMPVAMKAGERTEVTAE